MDLQAEVARLTREGMSPSQVQVALEQQGFQSDAVAEELTAHHSDKSSEDRRNSRVLGIRDVFDRIGYGGAPPQFINILFWLSAGSWPYILFLIGILNGLKTLLSVIWSNILQEYNKLHRFSKGVISASGVIFGFSFLVMAFSLLARNIWLFSIAFIIGTIGIVAYGDLYQIFVHDVVKRERMSIFLRVMAQWGVALTALTIIFSGFLLDAFPMTGVPWTISAFGTSVTMQAYGFLFAFELTAFTFIISGYITSFVRDQRSDRTYSLRRFLGEYYQILRSKITVFWSSKYVLLLTLAGLVSGLLQVLVTAYSGIAIYKILNAQYASPFFALGLVYAIAIIASFTGPFFTEKIHRSTGLAPTLVFGTLLMAVLPAVLVLPKYTQNLNIAAITAALCMYVIGGSITGFAQGLLTRKLLRDDIRHDFFRAQSFIIVLPYLIIIPILAWIANVFPLTTTFFIVAVGLVAIVTPLYFWLVLVSQRIHL